VRGARIAAAVAAVAWGYVFYGLLDLLVIFIDDSFYEHYLVETGWGLLFLVLVAVPLAALAFRPGSPLLLTQLVLVAAAIAVAAVATTAWPQLFAAAALVGTAMALGLLAKQGALSFRRVHLHAVDRLLGVLALIAVVPAVWYGVQMVAASAAGVRDDITWGLRHLPMQAAFAFALGLTGLLAAAGEGTGESGSRVLSWSVAVAAIWFGAVSAAYPEHVASLGFLAGMASVVWGVVFGVVAVIRRPPARDGGLTRAVDEVS
jgi:hypothetical protein